MMQDKRQEVRMMNKESLRKINNATYDEIELREDTVLACDFRDVRVLMASGSGWQRMEVTSTQYNESS